MGLTIRHDTAQLHETTAGAVRLGAEKSTAMSGKTDQIKGRIKEAAGGYSRMTTASSARGSWIKW